MQNNSLGLTGNQLKIIAAIAMTLDHVGVQLVPEAVWLRVAGRLALPLFAYMLAEGCRYTRNRCRHLIMLIGFAFVCQMVYFVAEGSVYQGILVTFSMSVALIYIIDNFLAKKSLSAAMSVILSFAAVFFITEILPKILMDSDFAVDYGFWGVMLAPFAYFGKDKPRALLLMGAGLIMSAFEMGGVQWYSLAGLILLLFYNGKRGRYRMKYFFYIYYSLHLPIIYFISLFINN